MSTMVFKGKGSFKSANVLAMAFEAEKEALFHGEGVQGILERGFRGRIRSSAHTKRGEKVKKFWIVRSGKGCIRDFDNWLIAQKKSFKSYKCYIPSLGGKM